MPLFSMHKSRSEVEDLFLREMMEKDNDEVMLPEEYEAIDTLIGDQEECDEPIFSSKDEAFTAPDGTSVTEDDEELIDDKDIGTGELIPYDEENEETPDASVDDTFC